jgi:CpeS-like protein
MDVQEFFELSAGKWFSQKTSHHLTLKQSAHGKSDLVIDILPSDDPQVIQLCQQAQIDPSLIWGGAKYTWKGTAHWDAQSQNQANQQGAAIVISMPNQPGSSAGKLFRTVNGVSNQLVMARYTMGEDNALTLVIEQDLTTTEDRIWFESNNVRLRTTIITQTNGNAVANFYTEIRLSG